MSLEAIQAGFIEGYNQFISIIPANYQPLINLLVFSLLIVIYAIFTWHFYRNLSKKDLLALNLSRYNRTTHPLMNKSVAALLNIVEYIIILPFLIFFWFATLALIILILSEGKAASQIITIAASIVAAVRILSYYSEDLSKDLAKLFPFTMLTISLLSPNFFSINRIASFLTELPGFFNSLLYYLILIALLELILRIIDTIINLFNSDDSSIPVPKPEK
ncbi:hypothetical protein AUJ84_02530 [Candidatus Pacearchaeota archaeon CG1_02_32_132]|nr:MAG: hypothetical protein AUJ84_02530 [Candidatus Pacearchaeota archaeon CG1_02_32_132]